MKKLGGSHKAIISALALITGLCLFLFTVRVIATDTFRYGFIPWNLSLIWLALALGLIAAERLKKRIGIGSFLIILLWLGFLPNTWYVLTDFIHVYPTGEISQLYDVVLIATLSVAGFTAGFISLMAVHDQLLKKLAPRAAHLVITGVLLLSSFGIYLGRDLRWNTWDVVRNPTGLILDLSDRIIDPLGHPRFITITGLFFVLLSCLYAAIYYVRNAVNTPKAKTGTKK